MRNVVQNPNKSTAETSEYDVAVHESAHAVVAMALGLPLEFISTDPPVVKLRGGPEVLKRAVVIAASLGTKDGQGIGGNHDRTALSLLCAAWTLCVHGHEAEPYEPPAGEDWNTLRAAEHLVSRLRTPRECVWYVALTEACGNLAFSMASELERRGPLVDLAEALRDPIHGGILNATQARYYAGPIAILPDDAFYAALHHEFYAALESGAVSRILDGVKGVAA